MAERVEVIDVNVEDETATVKITSEDGDLILMNKNDCLIMWNEFKNHSFRRDDPMGEKAYEIFIKMAKASGEFV